MATLDLHNTARHAGVAGRIAATFERIAAGHARRSLYRRTVQELGALSDRDLADLGIHRSMIRSIAADAAEGRGLVR